MKKEKKNLIKGVKVQLYNNGKEEYVQFTKKVDGKNRHLKLRTSSDIKKQSIESVLDQL